MLDAPSKFLIINKQIKLFFVLESVQYRYYITDFLRKTKKRQPPKCKQTHPYIYIFFNYSIYSTNSTTQWLNSSLK